MSGELPRRFGPYVLIAPLGRSARSTVYLARSTGEARLSAAPVVVKIHDPPLDDASLERVRRRAAIHTVHCPRISEVGRGSAHSFVVMEHVPGWTLARVLEAHDERWPVASAARLAIGIAQALGRLGTLADPDRVHGHLCPEKVLLGSDGRARLIGLDRPPGAPRLGFAPPEQLADAALDPRADLYALAAILWRLLTRTPWIAPGPAAVMRAATLEAEPRSVRALAPEVPARLDALIQTTLSPDRAARFTSADDFREALSALVPAAEGPEPDVSDLVGEALWTERESTRTILARAAESMMPFLRPGESFDGWGAPVVVSAPPAEPPALDPTAANAGRHTPVGAQRRFPATIIRRPDEPGTPRSDPGASEPIPYADTPSEARDAAAPAAPHPKLRAPTFQGTWAVTHPGQRDSDRLARAGMPTQDLLENARVVEPDATRSVEIPAVEVTRPMVPQPTAGPPAPSHPGPSQSTTAPSAPSPVPRTAPSAARQRATGPARSPSIRFRMVPTLLTLGALAVVAVSAVVIHQTTTAQVQEPPRETPIAAPPASVAPTVGAVAATTTTIAEASASPASAPTPGTETPAPSPSRDPREDPRQDPRPSPRATRSPGPSASAQASASASASPSPSAPTAAPAGEAAMARIAQLLARARQTRTRQREPARIAELDKVIGALILEASAPGAAGIDDRLRGLEATLTRLEAAP